MDSLQRLSRAVCSQYKSKSIYKDIWLNQSAVAIDLHEWEKRLQGQGRSDEKPFRARPALMQVAPVKLKAVRIKAAQSNKSLKSHKARAQKSGGSNTKKF